MDPISQLKNRVFSKKRSQDKNLATDILDMVRGFGCLGEIIGREFEVFDREGDLLYVVKQKPIAIKQLNTLLKEFNTLKQIDAENEAKKFGSKDKPRLGRR